MAISRAARYTGCRRVFRADSPFIGRLDHQKGVDLILQNEDFFANQDVQVVFLGSGRGDLQDRLTGAQVRHHHKTALG